MHFPTKRLISPGFFQHGPAVPSTSQSVIRYYRSYNLLNGHGIKDVTVKPDLGNTIAAEPAFGSVSRRLQSWVDPLPFQCRQVSVSTIVQHMLHPQR
jgi:hypothetical protein